MQRFLLLMFLFLSAHLSLAQHPGLISGNILDEKQKALENASVRLVRMDDSLQVTGMVTDKNGFFSFSNIAFGYYRLRVSHTGMQQVSIDSIHFRADRYDFNMNDIVLHPASAGMAEVIIYAEKPLIQSRDGNITFNAGESALAAGSNASELLTNVPLVTKDPDGKVLVRGKEPKILIDDKPVELNQQQLQDFLESMPGSSIEKIEVMTNPPPQYANEQGGVINIVTKKGTVGMNGRVSVYAGTRGDAGINGSFSYRKQGFSVAVNAGAGYNDFQGNGYSVRQNIYDDSTSYFNTTNQHHNQNLRPNFRANVNYDISKLHALNFTAHLNANQFDNANNIENRNINRFDELYRLRDRQISSDGNSRNMNLNFSYTMKTKRAGETLRAITAWNRSRSSNTRDFFEQFLNPDLTPSGNDSTQQQINRNHTDGYSVRVNYDRPMLNNKTVVSAGTFYNHSRSDIAANAYYQQKLDGKWTVLEPLTNDFLFYQDVFNVRASVKQVLSEKFSVTAGASAEHTLFEFDLTRSPDTSNRYWSLLPFATLNKSWEDKLNLTFSY
ncbi:MAG TPA: carboxypeptidase regulatory-like domain-containing protein, partial [Flavisolibacter sp.]